MTLKEKLSEVPYAIFLLFIMWCLVTLLCFIFYFIPTESTGNSITNEIPKILTEVWKYVTGATVSALATLAGVNARKKPTVDN
jgi:ABC-type uncharacterized transport system YnjBCD permease subunit